MDSSHVDRYDNCAAGTALVYLHIGPPAARPADRSCFCRFAVAAAAPPSSFTNPGPQLSRSPPPVVSITSANAGHVK
jgi:hypothetical protein